MDIKESTVSKLIPDFFVFFRKMHIPLYRTFFWSILDSRWYFLIIYRRQDVNSQDSNTKIVILFENYSGRQKKCRKIRKQCSRKLNPTSVCTWLSPFMRNLFPKRSFKEATRQHTFEKR